MEGEVVKREWVEGEWVEVEGVEGLKVRLVGLPATRLP